MRVRFSRKGADGVSWEIDMKAVVRLATVICVVAASVMWTSPSQAGTTVPSDTGYWLGGADGGVFSFGSAPFVGSATQRCTSRCTGFGATADGRGYWIVDTSTAGGFDPEVTNLYGYGSAFDVHIPDAPNPTAVASTPSSKGGWILYGNGGTVVPFGDARWFGDGSGLGLGGVTWAPFGSNIDYFSGIASTPDGGGYWLVGIDGGVFAYGDANYYGSMGGQALNAPVAGIARTSDGHGYWLVSWDGGVFAFGDAEFSGSMGGKQLNDGMSGIAANRDGPGYWTVAWDGGVFAFGGAPFLGSMANQPLAGAVFNIAASG